MEFAVIQTGGKQYKVAVGDVVQIEKLTGDFKVGDKITFGEVLLTDNGKDSAFGLPFIDGGKVTGTLQAIGRAKKVMVVKYKQKSRYFKSNGHRQPYFSVKIEALS
jgi:large subunit ribosomal protein L21